MSWRLAQRSAADPYGDWLRQIGAAPVADGWHPRVIYTRWGLLRRSLADDPQATVLALEALFSGASAYRVNLHDLEHWAQCDLRSDDPNFGQGHNELIIFEKARAQTCDLPQLLGHALAAPPESVFASDAGATVSTGVPASLTGLLTRCFAKDAGLVAGQARPNDLKDPGANPAPLVITAIIDHAIPFAHERFRQSPTQSRLDGIWQQGAPRGQPQSAPAVGRALSSEAITELLGQIGTGLRDEAALYNSLPASGTAAQRLDGDAPLQQSFCHGGMMLDLAAGRGADDPHARNHRILAVELPAQIVAQTNGFLHEFYVKSALNWIWFTARALYSNHPHAVILNYSFGDFCGRRDGQGMLDADFQLRLDRGELAGITVSAGNGFQSDCHAEISAKDMAQGQDLTVCLQPDDKTPSFVQFWLNGAYDSLPFDLEITPPKTSGIAPIVTALEDDLELLETAGGSAVARVYLQQDRPQYALPSDMTAAARTRVTLAFCPTWTAGEGGLAPAGRWGLSFKTRPDCDLATQEMMMLWVERGDSLPGFLPKGRQAYLAHATHRRRAATGHWSTVLDQTDNPIKRRNTLSANANAADVLSVAAFRAAGAGQPAEYSAAGSGKRQSGPALTVAIERSDSRRSVIGAGTLSGAARMGNGTSAASAAMSRHLAEAMLSGAVAIGDADIVQRLKSYAVTLAEPGQNPARSGAGVLPVCSPREAPRFVG